MSLKLLFALPALLAAFSCAAAHYDLFGSREL